MPRLVVIAVVVLTAIVADRSAQAQSVSIRGFGDVGSTTFSAKESFETILGSARGMIFGGGGEALVGTNIFITLRASRFQGRGERVFLFDGQEFNLGLETTVRVTPVEIGAGYRFVSRRWRVVPYAGGGIGWHRYEETSAFAGDDENVDERHTGYHLFAGAEVPILRWLGVAGEVQWTKVRDAIGQDPNGVSARFSQTDLGGVTFRAKFALLILGDLQ
jgi:hypothetical protein